MGKGEHIMQLEMSFPEMVEALERKYGNLSVASRQADIPHTTLFKIKKGVVKDPRISTLRRIAVALDVPLKDLIEDAA